MHNNNCDHIFFERKQATLTGGTVVHEVVGFTVELHNDPKPNSYATFDAQEVLHSELLEDLNKEYFKKIER